MKTERLRVQILILIKGGQFIYLFFCYYYNYCYYYYFFFLGGGGGALPNPAFNVVHNPYSYLFV